ncbi:MAG: response regulator [Anaerolineales bacterium]|nr:response regulator [Anaerolineales bacterium]
MSETGKDLQPNKTTPAFQFGSNGQSMIAQIDIWRASAINILLIVSTVAFAPAIIAWGWNFNSSTTEKGAFFFYLAIFILLAGMAYFRQLDYRIRAWGFLFLTYITGTAALILGGLAGDGRIYLIALPVIASILVNKRAGASILGASILTYVLVGYSAQRGWITDTLLFRENPLDQAIWLQEGIVMAASLAMVLVLQWSFNQFLESTAAKNAQMYERIKHFADELEHRVDERTAELKTAYDTLNAAKNEAERANLAKNEFLSRMSHELRAPMSLVLGFAQLLQMNQKEPLTPQQQENIGHILGEGEHLLRMIDQVLDFARIEEGQIAVSLKTVDARAVLQELYYLIAPLAAPSQIQIELNECAPDALFVRADPQHLHQVLLNLLSNAIKYNRRGGIVTISSQCPAPQKVRIVVSDTGVGISEEKFDQLFTPFVRLVDEPSEVEGTGLGLALSKRLMELMEGEIGVESTPGQGSAFWIELPLLDPPEISPESGTHAVQPAVFNPPPGKILYIEDYAANYELIRQALADYSQVKLLWAKDAQTGFSLAEQQQPDLIFLDLQLPDMHGYKVLQELKQTAGTQNIPVVIISADASPRQKKYLIEAGALDYLTKPFNLKALVHSIQVWLA